MRTKLSLLALSGLLLLGCPVGDRESPSVAPLPVPDTELCGQMCKHIGPDGLKCEEGDSVYDSDVAGPVDVPNVTCEDFCMKSQGSGYFMNPRCLLQVPSCDLIEAYRKKSPDTCKENP